MFAPMAPFIRIALRYIAAVLVMRGWLDPEVGSVLADDTDVVAVVQMTVGGMIIVGTELYYLAARHFGWSK